MITTYVHIELGASIRTKLFYEGGESQERLNSFSALDGWTITREGEVVTLAKGTASLDLPWGHVTGAIPLSTLDGWRAERNEQGDGFLVKGERKAPFRWADATPTIRAIGKVDMAPAVAAAPEPVVAPTEPETPNAKRGR